MIINCLSGAHIVLHPLVSLVIIVPQSKESLGAHIIMECWLVEEDLPIKLSNFGTHLIIHYLIALIQDLRSVI